MLGQIGPGPSHPFVRVHLINAVVDGVGYTVTSLQVHPDRPRGDVLDHLLHLWIMQRGGEKQCLHTVPSPSLDRGIQPWDILPVILLLQIICFVKHQKLHLGHIQLPSSNMVHHLLQSTHDNIHPLFQGSILRLLIDSTHEQGTSHRWVINVLLERHHALVGLLRQIPGGLQDDAQRRPLPLDAGRPLGCVRRVDLPDRRVPLNGKLDSVEIALHMKSLATQCWLQAHTMDLRRQIECLAQHAAILRERNGVILPV
mmetsp:Transcript_140978/g.316081  ORF Transcript_140978/g.316081 Transcript_140978/m.316081 type:complete len:256 (+) Transcript_140978:1574-2341(+)